MSTSVRLVYLVVCFIVTRKIQVENSWKDKVRGTGNQSTELEVSVL